MANPPDDSLPNQEENNKNSPFRLIPEKELPPTTLSSLSLSHLDPVSSTPTPSLNPLAHGWSRRPLPDTRLHSTLTSGTWARNKRWEYWGITTPRHILGVTLASLDYAGVVQLYVLDRQTLRELVREVVDPLARKVKLPETYGQEEAGFVGGGVEVGIREERSSGKRVTRINVSAGEVVMDVELRRGVEDDALCVVVPWSETRFQYTIKEPAVPAKGKVIIRGETHVFGEETDEASFGVLDHGRGRWPYSMVWNWAAGSGYVDGKRVALQLGAKWTEGTGSTENAVIVDGHLTKISEELNWEYDCSDWLKPWRVTGQNLDATFTPFHERVAKTALVVLSTETHQCFGTWSGTFKLPDGTTLSLDGLEGWAEEARNRW